MAAAMRGYAGADLGVRSLADRWWALAIRGALAIAFGVTSILLPRGSLFVLVVLFGAYALVDGVFSLVAGIRSARQHRSWGWLIAQGIVGIAVGLLTMVWPGITALALLFFIAAWAIATGVAEVAAAIRLRKVIEGEWLLGLSGALSITLGVLMFVFPGAGALAVVVWIAAYAIAAGVLVLGLAFRLRRWNRGDRPRTTGTTDRLATST